MFAGFMLFMIAIIVITFLLVEFGIPRAIVAIANVDSWWSPWRTKAPPGEMLIMVRGDPNGPFAGILESVLGWEYLDTTNIFQKEEKSPSESGYLDQLGVVYVGFFRYFLWREVHYDKWEMIKDKEGKSTGVMGLVPKVRGNKKDPNASPSIYFRYNMAVEIRSADTKGNFAVNAVFVITAQITNPAQAFFFAGGWESQTTAAVQGVFRQYASDKTIDLLREEKSSESGGAIDLIKKLGEGDNGLLKLFGTEIVDARFVYIDPIEDKEMNDALKALQIETHKAEAAKKRGEGDRDERTARAEGIAKEVAAWGSSPVGATVAMAEAIKVAKPQAIGTGIFASVDVSPKGPPV